MMFPDLLISASIVVAVITWRTFELRAAKREVEESLTEARTVAREYRNHVHPGVDKRVAELERRMNLAFPQPPPGGPFRSSGTKQLSPVGANDPGSEWDDESSVS